MLNTICPNCKQWQDDGGDCLNECAKRGLALRGKGPRPHGPSCSCCIEAKQCNECGTYTTAALGRCTNGRCRLCCRRICRHTVEAPSK